MAASKWDFLPETLREGLDRRQSGVSLDDGTLQDVVSRAAMPANMLAILFQKLSTDPRVPTDTRRGLEYLLYFIEGKKDGVGKDAQKFVEKNKFEDKDDEGTKSTTPSAEAETCYASKKKSNADKKRKNSYVFY